MNPKPANINLPPYQQSIDAVITAQDTHAHHGLSEAEASTRLDRDGANELVAEESVPAWKKFLSQFRDALVILLLVAAGVSMTVWLIDRESALPYEAMSILAIVLFNAIMGYIQASRAESAVAALRTMSANDATVVRDGRRRTVPAVDIVQGDLVVIEEGNTVPADARVIESSALQTSESTLTGESLPVSKVITPMLEDVSIGDRRNMIFSGTAVTYGHGKAIVTATGMQTEMGLIAGLLKTAPEETTPLQKELGRVGKIIGMVVVAIAIVMIATIIVVQNVRSFSALFDVLILGVALAIAAIPEGLPAVVTIALALGVQRMSKRNAIVRHLAAVETLGSASVIASDKTGTLTKNEMTVRVVVTTSGRANLDGTGYTPSGDVQLQGSGAAKDVQRTELERALLVAEQANNAVLQQHGGIWTVQGDPTEGALIVAARKAGLTDSTATSPKRFERIGEVPFSSERKLMTTIHTDAQRRDRMFVFTKGAPDVLLTRCSHELVGEQVRPLTEARRAEIVATNEELAGQALRTLGVAERELPAHALQDTKVDESIEQELVFLGLIGMIDPPREEAKKAVARAKSAGIRSIMITGDHPKTAAVIATELGISSDQRVITGVEVEQMSDATLAQTVREVSVYARVNPEHKLRIVKALQSGGAIVAMTGDGVNDAPALKTADIGVAMGITGTDVSKQAADVVLTDDNFATIVAAVEEGRAIFANIRKFLRYLLSSNIGEVMTMLFGVMLAQVIGLHGEGNALALPLLATQLLWLNLVTDAAPAMALAVDPADPGLMQQAPRSHNEGVITGRMWRGIFFVGVIMATGTLLVLDASLPGGLIEGKGDMRYAQTMVFTTLIMFHLLNVFNARSDEESAFHGLFANYWLWGAVGLSLALHAAVVYVPFLQNAFSTVSLSAGDWLRCVMVASSVLWLRELSKIITRSRVKKRRANARSAIAAI